MEFFADWCDSESLLINEKNEQVKCGTCLIINNHIIFLQPLKTNELESLRAIINEAIDHELNKRDYKC